MAEQKREYTWGTGMNSIDFFGFPVISAGLIYSDEGFEVLTRFEPNERLYKKLILKDDIVMGMVMTNQIDRAGIILGLMRNRIKVTSFKDSLLSDDFGLVYFPENVRKELLGK
jgi:NAD(P)H-nitrite reductase large subunit